MAFRANRAELLQVLESVSPGLSPRGILQQSNCFIFRNGRVLTFNDEIACKTRTKFPKDFEAAVKADPLLEILRKLDEDVVEITPKEEVFAIRGKGKETEIRMENEVVLKIAIEPPGEWTPLVDGFNEAVNSVQDCAGTDESEFETTCIHVHRKWIEATDRYQIARYTIETGLKEPVLFKRSALKHVPALGMTEFHEGSEWIHFKNPNGLIFSCRRFVESYPKLSPFLEPNGGKKTLLPKGLGKTLDRASIFSKEKDEDLVIVTIKNGRIFIQGIGDSGRHKELKKIRYEGKPIAFLISPKLLTTITERHNEVIISKSAMRVEGGEWVYTTVLGDPEELENAEKEKAMAKRNQEEQESEESSE